MFSSSFCLNFGRDASNTIYCYQRSHSLLKKKILIIRSSVGRDVTISADELAENTAKDIAMKQETPS